MPRTRNRFNGPTKRKEKRKIQVVTTAVKKKNGTEGGSRGKILPRGNTKTTKKQRGRKRKETPPNTKTKKTGVFPH